MQLLTPKLGKAPVKHDARTFKLARYLAAAHLPHPLRRVNWANGVTGWGMMKNDQYGDCTIACAGHLTELWTTKESGKSFVIPDSEIVKSYIDVTGSEGAMFDPATGNNDNGCAILDVLNYWRKTGIGGKKILGFASVDPKNHDEVKIAIQLFGGLNIGLALPTSANAQVGQIWDIVDPALAGDSAPGSWGGHCIPSIAYMSNESYTGVTWGALQTMTPRFWDAYCDEAYAIISEDWVAKNGKNPQGFDLSLLMSDLSLLK